MRTLPLAIAASFLTTAAFAADVTDPVNEVMKVTEKNWESNESDWKYLFDTDPLGRLYSKRFQSIYAEAAKHPAYDDEDNKARPIPSAMTSSPARRMAAR